MPAPTSPGEYPGLPVLIYRYTVVGSDKASIDTGVDVRDAGSGDWANGDLLEIHLYARTDEATTGSQIDLTLNNDSGSNYDRQSITANNATTGAGAGLAVASWQFVIDGASSAANWFSHVQITIPNYAGTVGFKQGMGSAMHLNSTAAAGEVDWHGLQYRSTSAITRFKVIPDTGGKLLKVGSQLLIYKRLAS
jgi:hypothetical protein